MNTELQVNKDRLFQSLMDMAQVGALPNGGCCRTALSIDDKRGRDLFVGWCKEAGCEVAVDQVGNIFARRPGRDNARPAVATGSHLDTQPHGGKFDGVYGVLAGLEVVRALNDEGIVTEAPIDVVVWTNEEGVRFNPPLAGSSAFSGICDTETVLDATTLDGTTVREDLQMIGYAGIELPGEHRLDCFVEAHIEQGPVLEAENRVIGVVTQVQGIRWLRVTVTGQDAHAGTTPMDKRKDALLGAVEMISRLNELAAAKDDLVRLTVGWMEVEPNSGSTVPGKVTFNCDLRHPDGETLDQLDAQIENAARDIAAVRELQLEVERPINIAPVQFALELVDTVRNAANRLGYRNRDMVSGAGHDAMNVAGVTPAAMIFVPCKDGISHNEVESATADDLAAGAHTLLHTLLARAGTPTY
jgi:beta-ureidopropionase / N-carbamoyl-L-amino-acid hydrolase